MRQPIRSHLTYANVVATLALFLVVGGGTALASYVVSSNSQIGPGTVSGHRAPSGDHPNIISGSIGGKDLAGGAVGGAKLAPGSVDASKVLDGSLGSGDIQDNGLTGADISESTLGEVPSAEVGGFGRSTSSSNGCNPLSTTFLDCVVLTVNLPTRSRVLLTGTASGEAFGTDASGTCKLVTQFGDVPNTLVHFDLTDVGEQAPGGLTGIAGPLGPGSVDFAIDCNSTAAQMVYRDVDLAAVAISPD